MLKANSGISLKWELCHHTHLWSSKMSMMMSEANTGMLMWTWSLSLYIYWHINTLSIPVATACVPVSRKTGEKTNAKSIASSFLTHPMYGVLVNSLMPAQGQLLIVYLQLVIWMPEGVNKIPSLLHLFSMRCHWFDQQWMKMGGWVGHCCSNFNAVALLCSHGTWMEFCLWWHNDLPLLKGSINSLRWYMWQHSFSMGSTRIFHGGGCKNKICCWKHYQIEMVTYWLLNLFGKI